MKLKNAVIGQRVVVKHIDSIGNNLAYGQSGVIIDVDNSICPILVKFDKRFMEELHSEDMRCWWVYPEQIKKEK